MRILFLVRSLEFGGAERQLVALTRGLRKRGHEVAIAVFYAGGGFEADMRASGIRVHHLGKRGRWDTLQFLGRVIALVRSYRPDVLHAYMHANVFAAVLKPFLPDVKIIWGIRSASTDLRNYGNVAWLYPHLERTLSRLADATIVNSIAARDQVVASGFAAPKVLVVPNGIDCEVFSPDPEGRERLRAKWGVGADEILIGIVARLDPAKDHANFIRAAGRVAAARADARFTCVTDPSAHPRYREELGHIAASVGVADRLIWAHEGKVTSAVYSALDVAVLSSHAGESFPNVIGEAMACGKPTVTTDSGDAALIVGDTGAVAPPDDHEQLARKILEVVGRIDLRAPFSEATRARIQNTYSVDLLASRTERALERLRAD